MKFDVLPLLLGVAVLCLIPMAGCDRQGDDASNTVARSAEESFPTPQIAYAPRQYVCYRADQSIMIDGRLDEPLWQQAPWTDPFVDIEGDLKPIPQMETRAKLLWDSTCLYIAAVLIEPDVWASLTQRDAVIYHDNDFEVFIDPDMDTHEYYELELNAFNTVWDLLLVKPYRDGGPAVNAWDIQGLKTAVAVVGTLNRPGDVDSGWSVEIALPWTVLAECAHRPAPPMDGEQWKINFSRVEWKTDVRDGKYVKSIDPATGKPFPENNWVWSPQGLIAMHYPEMWGIVQFSTTIAGTQSVAVVADPLDSARWALRQIYYAEHNYHLGNGRYTADIKDLKLDPVSLNGFQWPPKLEATTGLFSAELTALDGMTRIRIFQDGRVTQESK